MPAAHITGRLAAARRIDHPFRHWLLDEVLPRPLAKEVAALPIALREIGDTHGRRETHNSTRVFLSPGTQSRFPVCATIADAFQHSAVIEEIQAECDIRLAGSYVRIEYCQDVDGFWLEPHTDIAAKQFTMLIYLSVGPEAASWGTDLYDSDLGLVGRAPGDFNRGLIFLPAADTWHGFERRPINGVRRSLIVNYVFPEWRARHELAFPDRPVS